MSMANKKAKLQRNHVFVDFEVYFTHPYDDPPEVAPFEIAAVRVQGGRKVAELHSFVTPLQQRITSKSKPLPSDPAFCKRYSPMDLQTMGLVFSVFCTGNNADMLSADASSKVITTYATFERQYPDAIIAKDPATEREVLYNQMRCDALQGKLVDFDLFSQVFLDKNFSSRVADRQMHVFQKCAFHNVARYKAHHCALGDCRYLADVFIEWSLVVSSQALLCGQ